MIGPFGWIIDEAGRPVNVDELTHITPNVHLPTGVHRATGYCGAVVIVADSAILYDAWFGEPKIHNGALSDEELGSLEKLAELAKSFSEQHNPDGKDHIQDDPDQNPES